MNISYKHAGFGLSELLISLFLVSIIMTILTQFYLSTKRQYLEAQDVLSDHFDLQWVGDLLSDSVRRAGFTPCLGIDQLIAKDRRNASRGISGLKVENQPRQLIQVNRMSEVFTPLVRVQGSTQLLVSHSGALNPKRPILIADCEHAEVHQILEVNSYDFGDLITLAKPLMYSYAASTYVGEWLEEQWFIQNTAQGDKALYYHLVQTEELTPLIHSLQIKDQRIHEKRLVEIFMGLEKDNTYRLVVAVRGS